MSRVARSLLKRQPVKKLEDGVWGRRDWVEGGGWQWLWEGEVK